MSKHLFAVGLIYIGCTLAWAVLGGSLSARSDFQSATLNQAVSQQWGGPQVQNAPTVTRFVDTQRIETDDEGNERVIDETRREAAALAGSEIDVDLHLEQRRKGLLWYPTYRVGFDGHYEIANRTDVAARYRFTYAFPGASAVYDGFKLSVDGREIEAPTVERRENGRHAEVHHEVLLEPGQKAQIGVAYGSQGVSSWNYAFDGTPARDFRLTARTDFEEVDFPEGGLAATRKVETDDGWALTWTFSNLFAGQPVGVVMPQQLNPGPWAARVTFFAPVSLLLFFFVLFVLGLLRGVHLHAMHYFFLASAFFAFHLLLAYLVDHVPVGWAMAIASATSVALVVTYVRQVVGARFALWGVGAAQLVYLVGFAYTFFLEGFSGLAVALLSVATLGVTMQATARLDWSRVFARKDREELEAPAASWKADPSQGALPA
jgi:inner membrane protein involved in colicin E2 resistance